ncbi:putative integral membrane protein [Theileria parva strain Muguga]|uniref:Uncharacterized protein n=1 Tax=Theileria parva TaxID=5875 RepID=Q4N4W2_THEPA|nr:putative integral membrane protein [Theileria parva strain Muguga]EAN32811.1 putative integral membrane protein [Theileria parva strain Muguga]|eukprot:XP_765094.1 hypothetical protein [Theileria parva strain Muguga]
MSDSSGVSNDLERVQSNRRLHSVDVIWLFLGTITTFGIVMSSISARVYSPVLKIPPENSGAFESNLLTSSILTSSFGIIIAFLFFPINVLLIFISLVLTFVTSFCVFLSVVVRIFSFKFFYIMGNDIGCTFLGIIELIGVASVNDKFIPGNPIYKMLLYQIGKPIGYLLVLIITSFLELHSFGGEKTDFLQESNIFMTYQMMILLLLGIPILIVMLYYSIKSNDKQQKWRSGNLINSWKTWEKASYLYQCIKPYVIILVIIESSEAFFNSATLLFLMDPFPHFKAALKTLIIFILHQVFDLVGRCIPPIIQEIIGKYNLFLFRIRSYDEESGDGKSYLDSNCHLEQEKLAIRITKTYTISKYVICILVTLRIFLLLCIFFRRHFKSQFLNFMTSFPAVILVTMYNSLVRGLVVSLVYTQLASIIETDVPLPPKEWVFKDLSDFVGSYYRKMELYVDPYLMVSLTIAKVRVLELIPYVLFNYIGFKYNRILFECDLFYEQYGHWPTDEFKSNFVKFNWWIKMIITPILGDIKNLFGILYIIWHIVIVVMDTVV